jgi:uncharacterized protein YuzE
MGNLRAAKSSPKGSRSRDGVRKEDAEMMVGMDLRINYEEGKAYAAYLTFPHPVAAKVHRTREMEEDILVDFDREGQILGIEMLDPRHATWTKLNRILDRLQMPRLPREWVRPLRAA